MTVSSKSSGKENLRPTLIHKYVRWLIPSIGDLIFIALLGLLAFTTLSVRLLGDAGIGWHIRTGQLILATHAIPHLDPFSSTMAGHPWFAWEWIYDVLVGWLDRVAGLNGVVFFTAPIIALTFSWTFRLLLRRGTNFLVALALVLLAASASMIHFLARPHVVSWLFTVLWFWVLESSERKANDSPADGRRLFLWLLPPLMLVWVNVHGGFLLGFVLLGIYWLSAAWQWFRLKEDRFEDVLQKIRAGKRTRDLAVIGLLSALATLANPYGWRLHVHISRYLSNRFLMDHIDEFQSPNFHGVAQRCFAVLLLLTFVALAAKRREAGEFRASEVLVVMFAVYSGLYASRNIPVSSLLLILMIGPWLSDTTQELAELFARRRSASRSQSIPQHFFQRMQVIESSLHAHLWPIAGIVLTCWITFHGGKLGVTPLMDAHFDGKRFPAGAVSYLETKHGQGPVFAPDYWGGYLIYRLYPRVKVAVDDRHDFYGEAFLKSYLKMMHAEPGWQDFLEQYPVRYVVIPKDSALANVLAETPSWQLLNGDDAAVIFVPARSPIY
ncbi:MAG: hypothetical protein WCD48_05215 [Candidatus Sulfotelmatobacter sp.]